MNAKKEIIKLLQEHLRDIKINLETPQNKDFGDFSFPCFTLAEKFRDNPTNIAKDLSKKIKKSNAVERIEVKGPYINFFVNKSILAKEVISKILKEKEKYGGNKEKSRLIVEHTSINPNASPHLGRGRNALIGDSLVRILRFLGNKVDVHYWVNDVGKQISMLVFGAKGKTPSFEKLLDVYVKVNKEIEKNPALEREVLSLLNKYEKGDKKTISLFKDMVNTCLKGQTKILGDLGIKYDVFDYESEYLWKEDMHKLLKNLERTGKLFTDEDGRKVLDQKEFNFAMKSPVLVLTRADGTSLYPLRDIVYTIDKLKKGENILVLGEDQKLYFQQLKSLLLLLNHKPPEVVHYSFVLLPFFWCMLAASIYLLLFKKKNTGILIGFFYAFGIGVRPQDALFLTPLVFYAFFAMEKNEKIKFILSFALTFLAWFLTLLYFEGSINYSKMIFLHLPHYNIGFHPQDYELIVKGFFLSLGFSGFFLPYYFRFLRQRISKNGKKGIIFFSLWILPNFLFNAIVVSVHAGYQMDYLIALVLLSSFAIYKVLNQKKLLLVLVVAFIALSNLFIFFWDRDPKFTKPYRPSSFHYTDIRKNDIKLSGKVYYIKKNYRPNTTVLITTSTLWSPYMYHLKDYRQYSLEALFTSNPKLADQRRDSYNWEVREYIQKNKFIVVPESITTIILVDDEYDTELVGFTGKKHLLPGNSYITEIRVLPGQKIAYGYNFLKKLQQ